MGLKLAFTLFFATALSVSYPATPRIDVPQTYFGTVVNDPYHWLEQTQSDNVRGWVAEQTALASHVLSGISDRNYFTNIITRLHGRGRQSVPSVGTYATVFMSGAGNFIVRRHGVTRLLRDPRRTLGKNEQLVDWSLSPDGLKLAYATESAGNGWERWRALSTTSGDDFAGTVIGMPDWAVISWARNSSGFYYDGYRSEKHLPGGTPIGTGFIARFHRIGISQANDRVVYERPDRPMLLPYAQETPDGRYLLIGTNGEGTPDAHAIVVKDLRHGDRIVSRILPAHGAYYEFVANAARTFYFVSHLNAPNGKLIAIDLAAPGRATDVIAQSSGIIAAVAPFANRFVVHYFRDAASELAVFNRSGKMLYQIALPGVGGTTGVLPATASVGYYTFSSPTHPPTTYAYDATTNTSSIYGASKHVPFKPSEYVTEKFFAISTGGARVPVFVAHRRGMKLDGRTPTLLTGYGGFGVTYQPSWSDLSAAWLARGGVFAIAGVRGGGEYGETWHRQGMLGNKQHAFDDFASAAKLLIAKGFASPKTLAAFGYSGGGLLVGVTEVQHPDLFAAVAEEAGTVDVLRSYAYGGEAYWSTEVGSPVASAAQFQWLYNYAPLVHIRKGQAYPATLVMTSENDSYVSSAHEYKFAATLQWAQASPKPIILYVAPDTGHVEAMSSPRVIGDTEAFLWANTT